MIAAREVLYPSASIAAAVASMPPDSVARRPDPVGQPPAEQLRDQRPRAEHGHHEPRARHRHASGLRQVDAGERHDHGAQAVHQRAAPQSPERPGQPAHLGPQEGLLLNDGASHGQESISRLRWPRTI